MLCSRIALVVALNATDAERCLCDGILEEVIFCIGEKMLRLLALDQRECHFCV